MPKWNVSVDLIVKNYLAAGLKTKEDVETAIKERLSWILSRDQPTTYDITQVHAEEVPPL